MTIILSYNSVASSYFSRKKFFLLGDDFGATLKEYIDDDNIPVEYGGKLELPVAPYDGI
jgi:hypothetical protein